MTHFTPGLILEALLVVLLMMTVGYCVVLNGRLGRLRSSQHELRQIVSDLTLATTNAEAAIRGLRTTTDDAEAKLSDKLHRAQLLARELSIYTSGAARPVPSGVVETASMGAPPQAAPAVSRVAVEPTTMETPKRVPDIPARLPQRTPGIAAGIAAASASVTTIATPAGPPVDREAWRRHALSRLKRAS